MELPDRDALAWIVKTFAHLRAAHGDAIGRPALVQPTGEFFPDAFQADGASLDRLLRRVLSYAPVSEDLHVELAIAMDDESSGGGCGSSACGSGAGAGARASVQELDEGYRVLVSAADLGNSDVLATSLARSAGMLVLHEAGEPVGLEEAEVAAVVCGFGVLLANGASVWAKGCGGLRMAQATVLTVEEIAVGLALFVASSGESPSRARKHLGVTQREAFELAWDWVEANPRLIEALEGAPARLASGALDLEPVRGVLGQWLHRRHEKKLEKALRMPREAARSAGRVGARTSEGPLADDERRRQDRLREITALFDMPES